VRLKYEDGSFTAQASASQVQQALDLRQAVVRALVLNTGASGYRLLSIEDTALPYYRPDQEYFLFNKWEKALRELA